MRPALLLVDLQHDFLDQKGLEPRREAVIARAAELLDGCRRAGVPVIHALTTVSPSDDRRMPHWQRAGRWACIEGTRGHAFPHPLRPAAGEAVIHKTFFSAFSNPDLEPMLRDRGARPVIVCGVHLHACVLATVLSGYQRGFELWVAADAVASNEPMHAVSVRRWLEARAARFLPVSAILQSVGNDSPAANAGHPPRCLPVAVTARGRLEGDHHPLAYHHSPRHSGELLHAVPIGGAEQVEAATCSARSALRSWSETPGEGREQIMLTLAALLEGAQNELSQLMALELGKPVRYGAAEVMRAAGLTRAAAAKPAPRASGADAEVRRRPLGVVAMITPFNNPVAVPLGSITPALRLGNTVVWKPAPRATGIALRVMELLAEAGVPPGAVNLVTGDHTTAELLLADDRVDGATLTGGLVAGRSGQVICGRRFIPIRAELGGNNAAIVWPDADLKRAASMLSEAGFGYAGQRCTANRRIVVASTCHDAFVSLFLDAVAELAVGDPLDPGVHIGPLVSVGARDRVAEAVERARPTASFLSVPHKASGGTAEVRGGGAYLSPVVIGCDDPTHEIVQDETFGPVVVIQRAEGLDHALALCNGVPQGLAAALFSTSPGVQQRFLSEARAGMLKLNLATADAGITAPFGGWKASGVGPPEHGEANAEFFTRAQAVYRA